MKRISQLLKELWLGILLYGGVIQIIGLFFAKDRLSFAAGLWCGIILSMILIWHMHYSTSHALDHDEKGARNQIYKGYGIRMAITALVFLFFLYFRIGDTLAFLIAIFSIKIAAYLNPFIHKLFRKQSDS